MVVAPKFLIVAPSWVGDLMMAQALIKLLKTKKRDCQIAVLAKPELHPLLTHMPEVDSCLSSPFSHGELKLYARFQLAKTLRTHNYAAAYILPNSFKAALIPFWAKIPVRVGWRGEMRYGLINRMHHKVTKIPKMVDRYIALAAPLSISTTPTLYPQLQVLPQQLTNTLTKFALKKPHRPLLALCPGAEYGSAKRWPPTYFAAIAKTKKAEGWEVWILGSNKEQPLAQTIQTHSNNSCSDLTGKTDLGEVAELLTLATIIVTNDSGLMHIAAALNRPLIALYGSSSPEFTPPLTKQAKILSLNLSCRPCWQPACPLKHLKCLRDLSPQLVLQAITELEIRTKQP